MDYTLRKAEASDWQALQAISRATFTETFGAENTPEDLAHYLDTTYNQARLQQELVDPETFYYFLQQDAATVGYLKLNIGHAQTETIAPNALEIERIYLLAAYKGQGYGRMLIEAAEEVAAALHKENVWLGVWEHNHAALAFYAKMGYQRHSEHTFVLGNDPQTDYILLKELSL